MKFQTKIILTILPIVLLAITGLGGWSYFEARSSVYQYTYQYMSLILKETLKNDLGRRTDLLRRSKMDSVDFFVQDYQKEALLSITKRSKSQAGQFFVFDEMDQMILSTQSNDSTLVNAHWKGLSNRVNKAGKDPLTGYFIDEVYHDFYVASYFEPWGWKVFYLVEDTVANQSINKILWGTLITIAICTLGAVFSVALISKKILVQPVLALKESASKIANNEPLGTIAIDSKDELGGLARSMEGMSVELLLHNTQQLQLQNELKQANKELKKENLERKEAEQALEKSNKTFIAIVEHLPVMINSFNENGECSIWNKELTKQLGYTFEEVAQGDLLEKCYPDTSERIKVTNRISSGEGVFVLSYPFSKDGTRRVQEWADFSLPNGMHIGIGIDITERKQLEEQLLQSQKMESLGTMAGGIAHEFNNILSTIQGYIEMSLMDLEDMNYLEGLADLEGDNTLKQNLNQVYEAGEKAIDLVHQILLFSRKEAVDRQLIDPVPILKQTLKIMRATTPANIDINVNIEGDCGLIRTNVTQLHQVVVNLINNGVYALGENGGRINIVGKRISSQDAALSIPVESILSKAESLLQLTVEDTGCGIPSEHISQIFDPFFTTKEPGKGTGLGLSVVHAIIESHKGIITVDSEVGRGTIFDVYFALESTALSTEQQNFERSPPQEKARGKGRILVVEDQEQISMLYQDFLEGMGYSVEICHDGLSAFERFSHDTQEFDLVLSDMEMPKMTGKQLAIKLLKIRPELPIILSSGYSIEISDEVVRAIGVSKYLKKPVRLSLLSEEIEKCLKNNIT
ncbi:MAG: hypothetical protein COA42_13195 [Alteromonadaceae bacterium]|nr:MAG: hypothetical protein COA42_13195 [Alteromonadaceae bacterium]